VLESWVLHLRNLLSFFYDDRPARDDVVANDFVDDWSSQRGAKPDVLRVAHSRANREITHLSIHRVAVIPNEKRWSVAPITVEVRTVVRSFVALVPSQRVQRDFEVRATAAMSRTSPTTSVAVASTADISQAPISP
jgi:hypothetical protein